MSNVKGIGTDSFAELNISVGMETNMAYYTARDHNVHVECENPLRMHVDCYGNITMACDHCGVSAPFSAWRFVQGRR